jgi:hypothetical protein
MMRGKVDKTVKEKTQHVPLREKRRHGDEGGG